MVQGSFRISIISFELGKGYWNMTHQMKAYNFQHVFKLSSKIVENE